MIFIHYFEECTHFSSSFCFYFLRFSHFMSNWVTGSSCQAEIRQAYVQASNGLYWRFDICQADIGPKSGRNSHVGKAYNVSLEYTEQKMLLNQKHVYHGFKAICYRISNIFIGSCSIFLWINSIHAFGKKWFWFNSIFFSV